MHLTYPNCNPNIASVSSIDSDAGGAPTVEIEITPEMFAAGVSVLFAVDYDVETHEDVVRELLTAVFKNNLRVGAYRLMFPCY
jgi:hypothetical protein